MKKLFTFLMLMICFSVFAQEKLPVDSDGKITFSKVIDVSGTKAELYQKILQYTGQYFISANNQIQYKDEAESKIIARQTESVDFYSKPSKIFYNIIFDAKDEKVRVQIKDIVFESGVSNFPAENYPKGWLGKKKFYGIIENTSMNIIKHFEDNIKLSSSKNDDW
ncbi:MULTISPECIES: DUF4468 domain-containing protein [unclassified Empedobacter]|uniref:DUF4468 domain-containing protein n=1 Tax=unclassified Empedobacter TaxID=2643773 RepID=UPI0025C0F7F2|nr:MULTISPECIES: DUF4468 domain-containing protein [unclassified Empedobacter]